jgi:hypothetical protein
VNLQKELLLSVVKETMITSFSTEKIPQLKISCFLQAAKQGQHEIS